MKLNTAAATTKTNNVTTTKTAAPAAAAKPVKTEKTPKEKKAKLPLAKQIEVKANFLLTRATKLQTLVAKWPVADDAKNAVLGIAALVEALKELPKDFAAPKGAKGEAKLLAAGTKVDLREKVCAKYDDIIEPADRVGMVVIVCKPGRVVCKTKAGDKVILPRGHVVMMAEPKPAAEATPAN
jgi:hypothetical protein